MSKKIIFSISSDIGYHLALDWVQKGYEVIGTYRTKSKKTEELYKLGVKLFYCDFENEASILKIEQNLKSYNWDIICFLNGTLEPIGKFDECNFNEWELSYRSNFLIPLRIVSFLIKYRNKNFQNFPLCLFFAGGAVNSATKNFSSYTISKISLIKACELLDEEYKDIRFSIIGPGWVKTKIHNQTIRAGRKSGDALLKTIERINTDDFNSIEALLNFIEWIIFSSKVVISGRNFSLTSDNFNKIDLTKKLKKNNNLFKMRRLER